VTFIDTSAGTRVHVQDSGSGPPLVVLAGFTVSGLLWPAEWTSALERRVRLLRIDNRGMGHSTTPDEPFAVADMAADVVAVLDKLGIERAAILGWSMGGIVAQEAAATFADRVDRLVLTSTWPPGGLISAEAIVLGSDSVWGALAGAATRDAAAVIELDAGYNAAPPALPTVVHQLMALQTWTSGRGECRVNQPALVIHGDVDPLIPVENGRRLAELLPDVRYEELAGIGHLVAWEAPATAALVADFVHG
jgi:pimeloyl-ACP methyl ester carboxylesterase